MPASDDEAIDPGVQAPAPVSRAGRLAGVALLAVTVAVSGTWLARRPIATDIVDRTLAANGVTARYRIDDLGLGRQRLSDLVIGDPAHPDLVADWVEIETAIGLGGAHVTGVRAGHVRLHGRLIDGRLSLGSIDRLLPAPSGKPFALPHLNVDVADGRMRLESPAGVVGLKVSGRGMLDDGFSGTLAMVSERLALGTCVADRLAAAVSIDISDAQPHLVGPVRAADARCGTTRLTGASAAIDAMLGDRLDRWQGKARVTLRSLDASNMRLANLGGTVSFDGSPQRTSGALDITAGGFGGAGMVGQRLRLAGGYRVEPPFMGFQGRATADRLALSAKARASLARAGALAAGTPLGPLIAQGAKAGGAAARAFALDANLVAVEGDRGGRIGVSGLRIDSASGARLSLSGGDGISYDWPDGGLRIDGLLAMAGGGLPEAAIRLAQPHAGAPVTGTAFVRPYAAGGARLALTPVSFSADPAGTTRFSTVATLSGPIGADGRLDGGRMAIDGRWDGHGRVLIDPACTPLAFDRLRIASLDLGRARIGLCPTGGALLAIDRGRVTAGARLAATHLAGRLGSSPLALDWHGGTLALEGARFALDGAAVAIGPADRQTRIDAAALAGRITPDGLAGTFHGAGGRIGAVPLALSNADGDWRYSSGALDVTGTLGVADTAASPRFNPLTGTMALRLVDNRITASGTLDEPRSGVKVTDVSITHDLASGSGSADLAVPGIRFDKSFQPDALTPLTFGVIADVQGSVRGEGHIAWSRDGVTSTGTFTTQKTDLAAAFGPVTGLSTTIHFTDLLNMVSAPDQVATVDEINPGVAADQGEIHYQTLGSTRVQVLGAQWPFSGGTLTLEPTILDFSAGQARRLTFDVKGMDAAQFIQKFDFKNIDATGTFDGTLPMVFDIDGGRIENGRLAVRDRGGTIAYVGDLSQKDLGTWGNMAFQALKSLRYDTLDITMNGPLAGEMVTQVRFDGVHQGNGTHANFLVKRLMRLPFVFNVTIRAPFRQLISSAVSLYDPSKLPTDKLKSLLDAQPTAPATSAIQPPESETVP